MELGSTVSAVRSNRVLVGDEVCPAVIVIKDEKIHQILSHGDFSGACEVRLHLLQFADTPPGGIKVDICS